MTIKELAPFIKNAVESLKTMDDGTTFRKILDDDFAVYVGWGDGFDEKDEFAIHSKSQPSYCICVKVAKNEYPYWSWDDADMPWYSDTEEVYDTDTSVSPNENYKQTAKWLLADYREMKKLLKQGKITFGN